MIEREEARIARLGRADAMEALAADRRCTLVVDRTTLEGRLMRVLPRSTIDLIDFCETHNPVWQSAPPSAIGLSGSLMAHIQVLTDAARKSYARAETARNASKSATATLVNDAALLRAAAGDLIRQIKAFAELQTEANPVFARARIAAPLPASPLGAPGQPVGMTFSLDNSGAITLRWKAKNATPSSGTFFIIKRRLKGETNFTPVGTVGVKRFTDRSLPMGTPSASYQIMPVRGEIVGPASLQVEVQFGVVPGQGVGGGEGMKASGVKMAA